jgi:hypothetical protein
MDLPSDISPGGYLRLSEFSLERTRAHYPNAAMADSSALTLSPLKINFFTILLPTLDRFLSMNHILIYHPLPNQV